MIIVTGGAGFIGCNLAARLADRGQTVIVLDNLSRPGSDKNLAWLGQRTVDAARITGFSPQTVHSSGWADPLTVVIDGEGFVYKNGYRAYLDFLPLGDIQRESCTQLLGTLPQGIKPGTYTLRLVTGDGQRLILPKAFTLVDDPGTGVPDWMQHGPVKEQSGAPGISNSHR